MRWSLKLNWEVEENTFKQSFIPDYYLNFIEMLVNEFFTRPIKSQYRPKPISHGNETKYDVCWYHLLGVGLAKLCHPKKSFKIFFQKFL